MPDLLLLSRRDVRRLLDPEALLGALERAFVALSEGRAEAPPRAATRTPSGMLLAMPGHLAGAGLAAKLVTVFPDNAARDLPSHMGLIALFDPETGAPVAVLDAEEITALRTAAASALAVRLLARTDASVLAILGAGVQARAHLRFVPRVRDIREVRIASRTFAHAEALAGEAPATAPRPSVRAVGSAREAARGADVVCCCTDAAEPVLRAEWLAPGAHVVSVGGVRGPELDPEIVRRGRVFVEWRGAASHPPPVGAHELQEAGPDAVTELGELLSGARPGRRSEAEITVYKSTGHAVEDVAAAWLVYRRARAEGVGARLPL